MSILSDFEDRVGRAIEGVFAGVFRAPVQPAELARAGAREMDRRRKLGVGKVYAPTMFSVLLSPPDAEQLGGFAATLAGELETYLAGHARERGYELATRPRVRFLVDEGLRLGRFEVIGELLSPEEIAAEMGVEAEVPAPEPPSPSVTATVTMPGVSHDIVLSGDRVTVGRLSSCGIRLDDANTSRVHAAFEREGDGWSVLDLESTNGTLVNGARVTHSRLLDGDVVTVGVTELVYHQTRS